MKKYITLFIYTVLVVKLQAQFNYSFTNTAIDTIPFVDISTTGTPILMTDSVAGNSVSPQNIGFNFSFGSTVFTQFMIHADGLLQFGTTVPLAATAISTTPGIAYGNAFTNTTAAFQNILLPFFCDLKQGSAPPQYHLETTGTAPNRICTIQWKNLSDPDNANSNAQHQLANISFQVKLYETTNNIEFIYGNSTASINTNATRNVAIGIKNNSSNFVAMYKPSGSGNYNNIEFFAQANNAVIANQFAFQKNNIIPNGYTLRFLGQQTNDINVAELYVDHAITVNTISSNNISALIKNEGTAAATNIPVTLTISGANSFIETIVVSSLAVGAQQVIKFSDYTPTNIGAQQVLVTVAPTLDNVIDNNSKSTTQKITQSLFQNHDTKKFANLGVGFNGSSGMMAVKIRSKGVKKIAQLKCKTLNNFVPIDVRIYEDNGVNNAPSGAPLFTSAVFYSSADNEVNITLQPAITVTDNFYVSFTQRNSTNMALECMLQLPPNKQSLYNSDIFGTTWTEQNENRPFAPIVKVVEQSNVVDVGIDSLLSPKCSYANNETVSFKVNNYSNTIHDFSTHPVTVTGSVTNFVTNITTPFSITQSVGSMAAGGRFALDVLTNYNFSDKGYYLFTAKTICSGDVEALNDSLKYYVLTKAVTTKSPSDSSCLFGSTIITANTASTLAPNWFADRNYSSLISTSTALTVFTQKSDTVIYIRGVDSRNCFVYDSVKINIKKELPPTPSITVITDTLSHKNGFKATLQVPTLAGHNISWLGNGTVQNAGQQYEVSGFVTISPSLQQVSYVNGTCSGDRDSVFTQYSDGVILDNNNPLTISDTSFYDKGGATGNYNSTQYNIKTFTPNVANKKVQVNFYHINIGSATRINIYDGNDANAPLIFSINNSHNGSVVKSYTASNDLGTLTVEFIGNNTSGRGFLAGLTCITPLQYRTIADGDFNIVSIWESKPLSASSYTAATKIPSKGDDIIEIRNNLTISDNIPIDQTVITSTGSLIVNSGATLNLYKTNTSAELIVNGTLTNNGSIRSSSLLSPGQMEITGTLNNNSNIALNLVELNGTTPVVLAGNGTINKLKINNTNGVQVNGNISIETFLQLDNGVMHINNSNYVLIKASTSADIIGGSSSSYINGKLRRQTFIRDNTDTLFFAVGTSNLYRKIGLVVEQTSFDDMVEYEVQMLNGTPTSRTLPNGLSNVSQGWYHHISITNGLSFFTNAQLTIYYQNGDGVNDAANLRIAKDDGGTNWLNIGGTGTANTNGQITSNAFTSFSDFVLANIDAPTLPLQWQSVTALCSYTLTNVFWKTSSENNVSHFNILKSNDGIVFQKIGTVIAQNNDINSYNFKDNTPSLFTKQYYRLQQVDRDNTHSFSKIVTTNCAKQTNEIMLYPNPAKNSVTLNYEGISVVQKISLYNALGKKIGLFNKIDKQIQLNISHLKQGTYYLIVTDGNKQLTTQFIKL